MSKKLMAGLNILVIAALTIQLTGCGTILYPERKGQKAGSIDAGVAILDGIGLLFGFIPGVIAFAVDFNNGTIYLPGTHRASLELKDMRQVKFDPKRTTVASIEKMIAEETGQKIKLDQDDLKLTKFESFADMMKYSSEVGQNTQLSLLSE